MLVECVEENVLRTFSALVTKFLDLVQFLVSESFLISTIVHA